MKDSDALTNHVKTLLLQKTQTWVLAMMDIDDSSQSHGPTNTYTNINTIKINSTSSVIQQFCNQKPDRLLSFTYDNNDTDNGINFAILIDCDTKQKPGRKNRRKNNNNNDPYRFAKTRIEMLINDIFKTCNISISVGLVPIDPIKIKNSKQWIDSAIINAKIAKDNGGKQFHFDIFTPPPTPTEENKPVATDEWDEEVITTMKVKEYQLQNRSDFDTKKYEICRGRTCTDWVMAIFIPNNIKKLQEQHGTDSTLQQIEQLSKETCKICDIWDGMCYGYNLSNLGNGSAPTSNIPYKPRICWSGPKSL